MALTLRRPAAARRRSSFTASATRIRPNATGPSVDAAASQRQLLQGWQSQSFGYYRSIPELHFAGGFYARGLQNLRLYVGMRDSNNEIEEVDNNPAASELLDDVQDPGGGRSGMLGSYGRLMWLIGEGYMLVTPPDDDEGFRNKWEFVSPGELTVMQGRTGLLRQRAPGLAQRQLSYVEDGIVDPTDPDTGVAYRYWIADPEFSGWADAPMRGVLLLCDELERLTAAVRARAVSRPAGAGILKVPDEISQPPPEPVGDEDPQEDIFLRDLTEAMVTPIADPGNASAVVPMIVRGSIEALAALDFLQIHDPRETYPEEGLRTECIRRIATGLDMPPELLLGLGDSNHWSAWSIQEETWRSHLQPIAQRFCEDLTSSYFRPAAKEAGIQDWQNLVIWYDAAAVINHPDRGKDALDVWDRGGLSLEALREAKGFDDDDAPTEQDRAERIGIATRDSSLAWYGIPSVKAGGIEPEPGEIESPAGSASDPNAPPQITGAETEKGPPANPSEEPVTSSALLLGAAELTVDRCRELAGSRLRTKIGKTPARDRCSECVDLIREVPNGLVAAALGVNGAALELPTARELVAGGAVAFRDKAIVWGVDTDSAALLAEQIEQHAARTLFDREPAGLPRGFGGRVK